VSYPDNRGFSLLEAIVAITVVSLAAVAALAALAGELRSARLARESMTAAALAEHRMEALRLLPPEGMRLLPDSLERGRFGPPFEAFAWTAAAEPAPGVPDLFDVSVRVTGPEGEFSLATRLYRPEPQLPSSVGRE
jgi:prepilin-type N-terminal cleavage/methylation domain-containing protein